VSRRYRTARCILFRDDRYLLAVHASFRWSSRARWGLPGGQIEWGEAPASAVRRELAEELSVTVPDLLAVGAYPYKRSMHMVYGAELEGPIVSVDERELVEVRWFSQAEVQTLKADGALHADYELDAIRALAGILDLS
jgi:NADH pyrophosphatase NudC (nudix superfamily)